MATGSAGSLVVSLGLNAAEFILGLNKSEYEARKTAQAIKSSFENIQGAVTKLAAVVGIGLGVHAFKEMISSAIEAEAELQRLGARAGLTGSQLSSLIVPARLAHTDLETVAQASAKLSKALLDFSNDGAKSTQVLKSLGLLAKDIPALLASPQDALLKVAHLLDLLPEGGTKAGAQLLILGRAGGATAAFMEELAKQTTLVARRTDEEIHAAKELEDRFIKLDLATSGLKTTFANALIEPLNVILNALNDVTGGSDGARGALKRLVDDGSIREWALGAAQAVAALADNLALVGLGALVAIRNVDFAIAKSNAPSMKLTGKLGFSDEEAAAAEAEYQKRYKLREEAESAFTKRLVAIVTDGEGTIESALLRAAKRQTAVFGENGPANFHQNADRAADAAAAAAKKQADQATRTQSFLNAGNVGKDDPTKKILQGQIQALDDQISHERDVLTAREQFIQESYHEGYLSIKDAFDRSQEARQEALSNIIADYQKQTDLETAFKNKKGTSLRDQEDAAIKIAGYKDKARKATEASITQDQKEAFAREQANERYSAQLSELNAKVSELAGNTAKAAAIRFGTSQNTPFYRSLTPEARSQADFIAQQEIAQKALNDKNTEFRLILDAVGTAQEKINLLQQTGAISEIDGLLAQSAAARQQIEVLTDLADKAEIAAQALTGIAKLEAIANVERLRLEIAKLGTQTDLLGDKFQNIFKTSFVDNLTAAIAGTKSWADAFKDAEKQIVESISRIAAQNIGDALFGKEGPLGGLGSIFGKIFGGTLGGTKNAGASAADAALSTLSLTSATVTTAFASIATTGTAAAAALASVAGSSTASSIGGLAGLFGKSGAGIGGDAGGYGQFDAFAGYASGTNFAPGGLAWVGENGKELLNLPRGSQVIPMDKLRGMGRPNLSIVVNVPQGTSGPSADQIGIRVGAHVQRALNRNG